jgi:hypothetical protein
LIAVVVVVKLQVDLVVLDFGVIGSVVDSRL